MKQDEKIKPIYIGLETIGDKVLECSYDSYLPGKEIDYVKDRVDLAFKNGYIPDTKLLVIEYPEMENIPTDPYMFFPELFSADRYLDENYPKTVHIDHDLRAAAFCVKEGYEPTQANMNALVLSERYPEFCEENRCKIGILDPNLREKEEPGKRYDDWSFLFRNPASDFSLSEQKNILALGCLISNGLDREQMSEAIFPSFRELDHQYGLKMESGRIPLYDLVLQSHTLKQAAIELLDRKYPDIASTIKEFSGLSPSPEYSDNQMFVVINKSGEVIDARTNQNEFQNFYDYARLISSDKSLQERSVNEDLKIVWFCSLDRELLPKKIASDGELLINYRTAAEKYNIKPAATLNFNDAVYCFKNGRNPLHPDNRQEKLLKEDTYRQYCTELKKKHDIPQKLENPTKKHDRKPVINRHPQKKNKNSLKIR